MKPYYSEKGIEIYHGDCREVLPELGMYDLCLTDPPYGIGRDGQSGPPTASGAGTRKGYEFEGWDDKPPAKELFGEVFRSSCAQIIWGGNYFVDRIPVARGWIVWDKMQPGLTQSDGELAFSSLDQPLRIIKASRAELSFDGPVHPTQKPIKVMKKCIAMVPWAKSLLDPFMGSGSAILAAKDMGLRACGIEIQEKYCEIAANRLRQEVMF